MVSAEDIILGSTVVGVERRINFLESIVINLAVSISGRVDQYPIGPGAAIGTLAGDAGREIDVSIRDGFTLVSDTPSGDLTLSLWQAGVGELWQISRSGGRGFGVARDRSGNVYSSGDAAPGGDNGRVVKNNSSQVFQWETREWETDPGPPPEMDGFSERTLGCALTPDEAHIWVCDRDFTPSRMVKLATSDGSYVSEFALGFIPEHVAIDVNGFLYITDPFGSPSDNLIHKYNSAGTFVTSWGGTGTGDGEFTQLKGIAVATSRRSNNDVFVFAYDDRRPAPGSPARINVYAKAGGFRWERNMDNGDGPIAIAWGAQTEWFYYPTEDQADNVSAGTPDGGVAVPALNFYENQIIRSNIIGHMHIVIEILAAAFINAATGNTFNWTGSDNDNLYHVAVEAEEYDWLRPRKADLQGETIRPDEITEIELCLTKLEQSFPVTP